MTVAVCLMAGLEMDRLLAISANKQMAQLKAGFKDIQAANSANASDAKRIQQDTIQGLCTHDDGCMESQLWKAPIL